MKWERDKKLHALVGFLIAVAIGGAFVFRTELPIGVCVGFGLAVGAACGWAKEYLYDAKRQDRHTVDKNDFIATSLGALVGSAVLLALSFVF